MMLRTMRAIFNMPIKMTLLLLIYALTWHPHCPGSGHESPSVWAVAATSTARTTAVPTAAAATVQAQAARPSDFASSSIGCGDNHNVAVNGICVGSVSADDGVNPQGLGALQDNDTAAAEKGIRDINRSSRSYEQAAIIRSHRRQRHRRQIINIYEKAIENGFSRASSVRSLKDDAESDGEDGAVSDDKDDDAAMAIYKEIYATNVTTDEAQETTPRPMSVATAFSPSPKKDAFDWLREMKCLPDVELKLIYDFVIKYKQMPRVTYFTCRHFGSDRSNRYRDDGGVDDRPTDCSHGGKLYAGKAMEIVKLFAEQFAEATIPAATNTQQQQQQESEGPAREESILNGTSASGDSGVTMPQQLGSVVELPKSPSVLIKVVRIDQLISKRTSRGSSKNNNNNRNGYVNRGPATERRERPSFEYTYGRAGSAPGNRGGSASGGAGSDGVEYDGNARGRNTYANANWLERALASSSGLQQIVVLDLSCGMPSRQVLEWASNKGFFNTTYHWLLTEDRLEPSPTLANNPIDENTTSKPQSDDNRTASGATVASESSQSGFPMPADDDIDREPIETVLEQLDINIDTEMTLARPGCGRRQLGVTAAGHFKDCWTLYDVWNPGRQYGGQLNISEMGNFTLDKGLQIELRHQQTATIRRRLDMKYAKIRCMIVVTNTNRTDSLMHYLTTHYDTHVDSMNRFSFALLSLVREMYNFSFVLTKTTSWGYLKNGKFDGMIGALVRKQADIGGSPIFFRIERAKVIDYTARTWVARPCFIFRHPRSTTKDRIVFLQPFSNGVWISMAFCGIATILLLWLLTALENVLELKIARRNGQAAVLGGRIGAKGGRSIEQRFCHNLRSTQANENSVLPKTMNEFTQSQHEIEVFSGKLAEESNSTALARDVPGAGAGADGSADDAGVRVADWKHRLLRWGNIFCGQKGAATFASNRAGILFETVLFYVGSICQQGLSFTTRFFSGRCIIITSLLFSFSIYQFYSASIVGTLLMEKPKTIRTLRDLVHSSLKIGIEDIVYNRDYFLRTRDPDAIELYAKKVTSVPMDTEQGFLETPPDAALPAVKPVTTPAPPPPADANEAAKAKSYRDILHSHEIGAHAKTNEASNWYTPEYGVSKIKQGRFAFHVDVATAYKIIADTFTEKEICDLTEIQLFPPQKMVNIVQKGSPLRKIMTYGLRRVTEAGLEDYQRKVWHSQKPRCVKQIHTDDLRVDMQTFTSAFLLLLFGVAVSLLVLAMEVWHYKLWQRIELDKTRNMTP